MFYFLALLLALSMPPLLAAPLPNKTVWRDSDGRRHSIEEITPFTAWKETEGDFYQALSFDPPGSVWVEWVGAGMWNLPPYREYFRANAKRIHKDLDIINRLREHQEWQPLDDSGGGAGGVRFFDWQHLVEIDDEEKIEKFLGER